MVIYVITNIKTGMQYIGQTTRPIEQRIKEHCTYGKYNQKVSGIDAAIQKEGIENFRFDLIEECATRDQLNDRERHFIKLLNTRYPNGYNKADGGNNFDRNRIKFVKLLYKLVEMPQLTGEQYKTLLTIMLRIEKSGGIKADCTIKELSEMSGLHKNAASRGVKFLADNGYIKKEKISGTCYSFTLGEYFNKKEDSEKI